MTHIAGLDYPRLCILTDGAEIIEASYLYDWELAERNRKAKQTTGDEWWWCLADKQERGEER